MLGQIVSGLMALGSLGIAGWGAIDGTMSGESIFGFGFLGLICVILTGVMSIDSSKCSNIEDEDI